MGPRSLQAAALFDGSTWRTPCRVEWDDTGFVRTFEPGRSGPADLVTDVVIPGLVNAHVHLDLDRLPVEDTDFHSWIDRVIAMRAASDHASQVEVVERNLAALVASGTTAVGDIDGTGAGYAVLCESRVRATSYQELLGFDLDAEQASGLIASRTMESCARVRPGLSPHAPYSVSAALVRAAVASGLPVTMHVAETAEEVQFLTEGRGSFRGLLERLGKLPPGFEPPRVSPVRWLDSLGVLGPNLLLAHAHHVDADDIGRIARAGSPVVVCPGTVEYFGRTPPPVSKLLAAGVKVALGTDSLASNTALDVFGEMRRMRSLCPDLDSAAVLRAATDAGGNALGLPGAGRIGLGWPFDAVLLTDPPELEPKRVTDWVTTACPAPAEVLLAGRPCRG